MSSDLKTLESQIMQIQLQVQQQASVQLQQSEMRKELEDRDNEPTIDMRDKNTMNALVNAHLEKARVYESMTRRLQEEVAGPPSNDSRESRSDSNKAVVAAPEETKKDLESGSDDTTCNMTTTISNELCIPIVELPSDITSWKPFGVIQMGASKYAAPKEHTETFSWEFLQLTLGGKQWCSGFYWTTEHPHLPGRSYWLLEGEYEPFAPQKPGQHGAKMTAVFNTSSEDDDPSLKDFMNSPVFICAKGQDEYRYFGTYSQTRYSDRIGYDTLSTAVPEHVLRYWAEQLADKKRPSWVTKELRDHFWPQPKYDGPIPVSHRVESNEDGISADKKVLKALRAHAQVLQEWEEDSLLKVGLLTEDTIMAAFQTPDLDTEPGLRLWWEYLECTGYDSKLYDALTKTKKASHLSTMTAAANNDSTGVTQESNIANKPLNVKKEGKVASRGQKTPTPSPVPVPSKNTGDLELARQMHDTSTKSLPPKRLPPHARK
ncbi:Hypothetical protein R9X50_00236700 [Acrodontium crateriforme]|uniref:DUF6697 domain-containing protein n=1 Tax=Acrodontium crateriforme TaxID=150365 RepID=A0AAQ3R8H7_9PEZI|nr:Hypothetical protein R9X50_00236700 [Acrodontium crateriforme]